MTHQILRGLGRFVCAAAAAAAMPAANAAIIAASSTVQPATTIVALGQANSLVLNWSVTTQFAGTGPPGYQVPFTVTSTGGQFVVGATTLATTNTILSASASTPYFVPATVRLTESLAIPQDVVLRAHRLGASTIAYVRQFNARK